MTMSLFDLRHTCRQSGLTGHGPQPLMCWCTDPSCPAYVRSLERRWPGGSIQVFGTCLPEPDLLVPTCGTCPWADEKWRNGHDVRCGTLDSPYCRQWRARNAPACMVYRKSIARLRARFLEEGPQIETLRVDKTRGKARKR